MYRLLPFYSLLIIILNSTILLGQYRSPDLIWEDSKQLLKDKKYQLVIDTLEVALSILKTEKHQDKYEKEALAAKMHRNTGMAQRRLFMYERAEESLDIAVEKYQFILSDTNAVKKDTSRLGVCLQQNAILMRRWGEFEKALFYADEALKIFTKIKEPHNQVRIGNILAGVYFDLKNFEKAEKTVSYSIQIYHNKKVNDPNLLCDLYTILANTQMEQQKYSEAIKNHNMALNLTTHASDSAITYNNLGIVYTREKKYKTAAINLRQSLSMEERINNGSEYHPFYAPIFENVGDLKAVQNNFSAALHDYQLALINLSDNFRNKDPNTNPTVKDKHYIYNKPDLLRLLDLKAQAALKAQKNDLAYDTYEVLDEWINEFYQDLSTNQSKLTWIARAHDMYSRAIQVALKNDDQEKAFQYAEKARAVLLWQSHSQQAALSLLDEEKREKYDNLLAQIRQTDYKYRDAIDKEKNKLKTELDALNRQFDQFENSLGKSYAQRKYQPKDITLDGVQADILNETTALVEYHWSADNMLYIFTLTKNDIHVDTVRLSDDFEAQISSFLTAINSSYNIVDSGYPIYQKAFAPVQTYLDKNHQNIQKIILLPDGKLNQIPFEALPTSPEKASITHLIRNYTFNHLYSCDYSDSTYTNTIKTALLIAPEYGKADKLDSLSSIMKNKLPYPYLIALTGEVPKRDTVINQIPHADLIHIRAHAEQGTKNNGKIYLYDNTQLTQQDIQALDFKARHVVLDACETGTGKVSKGEGVLSLGWSFVYRGVPSVVMSFWKVNPSSTEILMENYHQQLKNGIPADEALRQAKLKLLDQRKTKKEQVLEFLGIRKNQMKSKYAEPNHWAAFIHTGNPPTKQFNQNTYKYFYILGGLLMLFFIVYLARKR